MAEEAILRFDQVSFEYVHKKPILDEASFVVRKGAKITLMGQNGAGKSTIFGLIKGELQPKHGQVSVTAGATIGAARQMIAQEHLGLTIEDYFATAFDVVPGNLKSRISKVLEAVNLDIPLDRIVGQASGGQQSRLLLAYSLIQDPDILLLDEPTNNLDRQGIDHLVTFLIMYDKTVIVISHDADFLNCFTEGVIYLDIFTHQTELYVGDYYSVVAEIQKRIEREVMQNAQLEKKIQDRKEKVNFFANKGGKMRKLAQKMREETAELEENKVDVRREDKTIRRFEIPAQENIKGDIVNLRKVMVIKNQQPVWCNIDKSLGRQSRLLVTGPNGIGKSNLLRSLVNKSTADNTIAPQVTIGYYSQDFSALDFQQTVIDSLRSILAEGINEQEMRSTAAGFFITGDLMERHIGQLSEGQKGLLSFARLVLMKPGLLILDEPTNHINFRHIPIIAEAINNYQGAIIMVSHMADFVKDIEFSDQLNLGNLLA